jgi:hypothetical protein
MLELLLCGTSVTCGFKTIGQFMSHPKYPPDVAQLCYYFEAQKVGLPDYCKWQNNVQPPRRRNEF